MEQHVIPAGVNSERLDRYASGVFSGLPSKARARKAAKAGTLLLNHKPVESSRFVHPGDILSYTGPARRPPKPYPLGLEMPWVDETLAVVVKPAGLLTNGNRYQTLEAALVHNLPPPEHPDSLPWARPSHRLDFRTGGLLIAARTHLAQVALGRAFEHRQVEKRYRAIVSGRLEGAGTIDTPVEGRNAETRWEAILHSPITRVDTLTTLDLWPHTGRTHQLRRHMSSLGHPILGDDKYTPEDEPLLRGKGLFLWAVAISFPHPVTGERVEVAIDEPPRFEALRRRERARVARWKEAEQTGSSSHS